MKDPGPAPVLGFLLCGMVEKTPISENQCLPIGWDCQFPLLGAAGERKSEL